MPALWRTTMKVANYLAVTTFAWPLLFPGCNQSEPEKPTPPSYVLKQIEINGEPFELDDLPIPLKPEETRIKVILELASGEINTSTLKLYHGTVKDNQGRTMRVVLNSTVCEIVKVKENTRALSANLRVPEFEGEAVLTFSLGNSLEPPLELPCVGMGS